jgi:transcription antitermination protein NusB
MISRRLLRIKVLQELYALHKSDAPSVMQFEKELVRSIDSTYDLYRIILLLLAEMQEFAEDRINMARLKKAPAPEDLNPNTQFVNNRVLNALKKHSVLFLFSRESKFSWKNHLNLVKDIYGQLCSSEAYAQYMEEKSHSFEQDKTFIISLLDECVLNSDIFEAWLEEQSIFWNDDIEYAGTMAAKTLICMKENETDISLVKKFKNAEDEDFYRILFRKSAVNASQYDEMIQKQVENWDLERIAFMDILIMHMAIAEMIEFPSIPIKVSLNEYLEISKYYSTEKSSVFINGILDKIIAKLKKDKIIVKTGRGLVGDSEIVGNKH